MGKALSTIGIIFIAIIILLLSAGIYLYNFHVFKIARVCVTNKVTDLGTPCSSSDECIERMKEESEELRALLEGDSTPAFIKPKIEELTNKILFCETTCKRKETYGTLFADTIRDVDSCQPDEDEITLEIRGKEGIQIFRFMRNQEL